MNHSGTQRRLLGELLELIHEDYSPEEMCLREIDLLDYFAILGVRLVEDDAGASRADYMAALNAAARNEP